MLYRNTIIRIVDPNTGGNSIEYRQFDLHWAALAAAEETLQGGPLYSAWLRLFQTHLSNNARKLQWRGDLAESAEMRRAYSAIYGRYFSRGILASRLGVTDFVSLERKNTTIKDGVTVNRKSKGDIPDWIAWDPINGSYVLAEAKGNLTGKEKQYLCEEPPCIKAGKAQFGRVRVKDSHGRKIRTRNWVTANLWSTEVRKRLPVSLLWNHIEQGEDLRKHEIPVHAAAIRKHRIASIATRLMHSESFRPGQEISSTKLQISIQPSDEEQLKFNSFPYFKSERIEELSTELHEDIYIAAIITPLGVRPILGKPDLEYALDVQHRVNEGIEVAMIYGLSMDAVMGSDYKRTAWLSGGGIASTDGAGLFNLKDAQISEA